MFDVNVDMLTFDLFLISPHLSRGPSRIPMRAIAYLAIAIFQFFSLTMLLTGLCCVLVSGDEKSRGKKREEERLGECKVFMPGEN